LLKLAVPVLLAVAAVGCGGGDSLGGTGGSGGNTGGAGGGALGAHTYTLPGRTQIEIAPGECITVNTAPETLPASTVSYALDDGTIVDSYEVAIVPNGYPCEFVTAYAFLDHAFTGSASVSGPVPDGIYDLDVMCQNVGGADCLTDNLTWSATY